MDIFSEEKITTISFYENKKKHEKVCNELITSRWIEHFFLPPFQEKECPFKFLSFPNHDRYKTKWNYEDFKKELEVKYWENDSLLQKSFEIKSPENIERIKNIVSYLAVRNIILKVFDINDFYLDKENKIFLARYHNLKVLSFDILAGRYHTTLENLASMIVPKIMRCNGCHSQMEIDLSNFIENPLRAEHTHYICPHCRNKKSLPELISIYKENTKNSYYSLEKSGDKYYIQKNF